MTTAEFSIDGSSSQVAHAVAFNTNVALAIINTAGIDYAEWEIVGQSHTATTATITPGTLGLTATLKFPADPGVDWSVLLRCKANGGRGANGAITNNLFAYAVIGTTAHGSIVPFSSNEGYARNAVTGWCEDLNLKTANATTSSAGLMTAAQVTQLNAAILAKAHGRSETDVALSTNNETVLVDNIAITGLVALSSYAFVVGARICAHQSGSASTCGFIDVVAFGYTTTDALGNANAITIQGSTPDQSKLPASVATMTARVTDPGALSYFKISATRPAGIAMVVDSVEYWISALEKLTT